MASEVNMDNRDPNQMNGHIQVMFDDVLAEPEGAHSVDCVWRNSYKCFDCGLSCCYKLITFFCGLPIALMWGCYFACISFNEIWCVTPFIRVVYITMTSTRKLYAIFLSACLAPLMEAVGLIFGRIHVTNSSGEPPKPLGAIDMQDVKNTKRMR